MSKKVMENLAYREMLLYKKALTIMMVMIMTTMMMVAMRTRMGERITNFHQFKTVVFDADAENSGCRCQCPPN